VLIHAAPSVTLIPVAPALGDDRYWSIPHGAIMKYRDLPADVAGAGSSGRFGIDIYLDPADDPAGARGTRLVRVRLSGQLDRAYTEAFRTVLRQLRCSGFRDVALDLSALDRLSASGAVVMMSAIAEYTTAGGALNVVRPSPRLPQLIRVLGHIGGEGAGHGVAPSDTGRDS
jgi:anti-anti-sigma factor